MRQFSLDDAIAIQGEIYWVGNHVEDAGLQCNTYLLLDDEEAVLIDPGSIPDFPVVMRKIIDLINPVEISTIIAHHQDPDVCGNLPVMEDIIDRNDLLIAAHTHSKRLIGYLGPKSGFYQVDKHDYTLILKSGRVLEFMFTPFLHSPGAIVTYDARTKTLFSSDIFGALPAKEPSLFAGDGFLKLMEPWHQAYMPSNAILKGCLETMQKRWRIDRILPQHGTIIEGENVGRAFAHLKQLPCGMDLPPAVLELLQ